MRAIILILILLVVGAIALVATGFVSLNQVQPAQAPRVSVGDNGVVVQGGQAPRVQVETGRIEVGTGQATVPVPQIRIAPGANGQPEPPRQPQPAPPQQQPQQPAPPPPAN